MSDNALWAALYDLYELLADKVNEESAYQAYFLKHPIVFSALGYDVAIPFDQQSKHKLPFDEERRFRPGPDFLCADSHSNILTIFELKTPFESNPVTSRQDGNRLKFKATVESHLAQAMEYVESIRGREAARKVVRDALGLSSISAYRIVIPYGLTTSGDPTKVAGLAAGRQITTDILPYDHLLDLLAHRYELAAANAGAEPGWSCVAHVELPEAQLNSRAYLFDMGSVGHDRASILVEKGSLVFEVTDSNGTLYRSQHCAFETDRPIYLRWEFSSETRGMLITFNIDNKEVDFRRSAKPITVKLRLDTSRLTVGADLSGKNNGKFKLFEYYVVERLMNTKERLGSFHYFRRRTKQA